METDIGKGDSAEETGAKTAREAWTHKTDTIKTERVKVTNGNGDREGGRARETKRSRRADTQHRQAHLREINKERTSDTKETRETKRNQRERAKVTQRGR